MTLATIYSFRKCISVCILAVALFFVSMPAAAFDSDALVKKLQKNQVASVRLYDKAGIIKFYEERNFEPVWISKQRFNKKAKQAVNVFKDAWEHGLNPDNYAVGLLSGEIEAKISPEDYELLLSAAIVRYGRDMTSMRVPPNEIGQKSKFWQQPLEAYTILSFVANDRNPKKALQNLAPTSRIYKILQKELLRLTTEIKKGDETERVLPIPVGKSIRLGDTSAIVEDIRYRLRGPAVGRGEDPKVYDDRLSKHVMKFQEKHGLRPDGVIGRKTIQAMNMRLKDRLDQVIVNMERARWISPQMPGKYLVVNIPAQTLWAIENDRIVHEMPVIIGRKKRQTNSFITKVTGVRFNPTWTVPETIKFEDYLPELTKDPNYLNDKGVEFYWGSGSEALSLPPESIQWAHLSEEDINAIRIVQKSGATNPLGRVRLHMPNQYNIYLHDTSSPGKFHREDRALSSGCVRMKEPEKIANFVLADNKGWSEEKMRELIEAGEMRDIWTQKTTPVYLLYQTVWLDSKGELIYGQDVYSRDKTLMQVLKKYGAVKLPSEKDV